MNQRQQAVRSRNADVCPLSALAEERQLGAMDAAAQLDQLRHIQRQDRNSVLVEQLGRMLAGSGEIVLFPVHAAM